MNTLNIEHSNVQFLYNQWLGILKNTRTIKPGLNKQQIGTRASQNYPLLKAVSDWLRKM